MYYYLLYHKYYYFANPKYTDLSRVLINTTEAFRGQYIKHNQNLFFPLRFIDHHQNISSIHNRLPLFFYVP